MNIKTAKICNIGGRQKNDDTAEIALGSGAVRAYVGDGLGSYAGGKQASETAGQALLSCQGSMLSDEALRNAAQLANQAVYALQNSTKGTMKTTIVFLTIEQDQARWMHVGDSRLYHFCNGKLVSQTVDHSVSQMAVMMGEITTHQIRFHEDRNRVLRSLGGENAKPELSNVVDLSGGNHAFLLCTDGFWEYVYEEEMEQTLQQSSNPDEWVLRMEKILLTRVTGHNDNYTAAAVFVEDGAAAPIPVAAAGKKLKDQSGKKAKRKGKGLLILLLLLLAAGIGCAAFFLAPKLMGQDTPATTVVTTAATEASSVVTEASTAPVVDDVAKEKETEASAEESTEQTVAEQNESQSDAEPSEEPDGAAPESVFPDISAGQAAGDEHAEESET